MSNDFKIGDRVRATQAAVERFWWGHARSGTVVGLTRDPNCINVKMDGLKTPAVYSKTFWERISDRKQDTGVVVAHQD